MSKLVLLKRTNILLYPFVECDPLISLVHYRGVFCCTPLYNA